jgi:serine/threonine protein kinase
MLDSSSVLTVGQIVPDYELLRRIGSGSYGEVWLARGKATGILRAAKIVWRHTFDSDRPFQREFEGIQHFERVSREHPSQLSLFHIGRNDSEGYFYYVMELADNVGTAAEYAPRTLRADLSNSHLPAQRVLEIGLALTEALGHLHQNGLVHRDVKPSNVIFVNGRPKLADIGLVTNATDTRSIVGTEGYLPPEGPGTPQADIFALGKVLYECATGLDRRQFPRLPPSLRSSPDADAVFELNEIIIRACAETSKNRYPNCDEMIADLAVLQQGRSIKQKKARQRRRAWAGKAAAVSGLVALAAVATTLLFRRFAAAPSAPVSDVPDSTNIDATLLCEKGLTIIRGDNYGQFAEAVSNFTKAIKLDPNFAKPYVGLLEVVLREPVDTPFTVSNAVAKVIELAPHSGAAYCAQSIVAENRFDFVDARRYAAEAVRANPNYELAHTWYGFVLTHTGRPLEGRAQLEISRSLAPSKAIVYRCLGHTYYVQRDFPEAAAWYRRALELDRHHVADFLFLGRALRAGGDFTNGLEYLESRDLMEAANEPEIRRRYDLLRAAFRAGGPPAYWEQEWKFTVNTNADPYWKGAIQAELGNTNAALDWLEKACNNHLQQASEDDLCYYLLFDEYWDPLRSTPRFKRILDEVGFSKVMPPQN